MKGQVESGKSGWKENALPIAIVLILAIIILGRAGYLPFLGNIPLIGSWFKVGTIKVVVIGQASDGLISKFNDFQFKRANIELQVFSRPEEINDLSSQALSQFDVVILDGTAYCSRETRQALLNYMQINGKMIVIGDACTKLVGDPNVCGWSIGLVNLGDYVPVKVCGTTHVRTPVSTTEVNGQITVSGIAFDHPIFQSLKNFGFSGQVWTNVEINNDGPAPDILAWVDQGTSPGTQSNVGIVESQGTLGWKTIYFAYDIGADPVPTSSTLLLNTILYLKNVKA
ncbi:Uncharacterised protein [uncultured archaeon]|nr:Uncharacterised protein [uncultured archaeon]